MQDEQAEAVRLDAVRLEVARLEEEAKDCVSCMDRPKTHMYAESLRAQVPLLGRLTRSHGKARSLPDVPRTPGGPDSCSRVWD